MIVELAENANAYQPLGPRDERVADPAGRFVLWIGDDPQPTSCVAQRFRLSRDGVDEAVAEIRRLVRDRGRAGSTWEVAASATPADLVERLVALGMTVEQPLVVGMALRRPLTGATHAGVEARRVESVEELVQATRVQYEAFEMAEDVDLSACERRFAEEGAHGSTFVALLDGEVVAAATSSYTEHGVLLFGGATARHARGRGAYRALVAARYDDAVARGTPTLVTHASPLSRPILARLGFEEISTLAILLDEFCARA